MEWIDKINDVDYVLADDINAVAHGVIDGEEALETHKNALVLDHPDASVTTAKIADSAVTFEKIDIGAVSGDAIADFAVTTRKIDIHSVTKDKLSSTLSNQIDTTERSLDYLWKKSKGIIYDTETVTGNASTVSIPSGAMEYAEIKKLGGKSTDPDEPTSVNKIILKGRNLFDAFSSLTSWYLTPIDFGYVRENDIYTFDGEYPGGDGGHEIRLFFNDSSQYIKNLKPNTRYTACVEVISGEFSGQLRLYIYKNNTFSNTVVVNDSVVGHKFISRDLVTSDTDYNSIRISFYVHNSFSATANNLKVKVSLIEGDYTEQTMPSYVPYHEAEKAIPSALITYLSDKAYGMGSSVLSGGINHIDFEGKKYIQWVLPDGTDLTEPLEYDISSYLPDENFNILQVEAGGSISFKDGDGEKITTPVFSLTEFMVDVEEV